MGLNMSSLSCSVSKLLPHSNDCLVAKAKCFFVFFTPLNVAEGQKQGLLQHSVAVEIGHTKTVILKFLKILN